MIHADFETIARDISELRDRRDQLAAALTESITRLRRLGTCPPDEVLTQAASYRRQYGDTRQRLSQEPWVPLTGLSASLEDWEQAVQLAQRQQHVSALLDEAAAWQIRGVDGPGPLASVRQDVEQIRTRLQDDADQTVHDLIAGRHPLTAMRTLVHCGDDLPDGEWAELLDRVLQGYGRELATAISRGKVLVRAEVPSPQAATSIAADRNIEVMT